MNEDVHWFANPNTETLNWPRVEKPYLQNGSGPKAFPPQLVQRRGGNDDIAEKGMNEDVHWFANPNTETLNWPRVEKPYLQNGSGPKAFPPTTLHQTAP